MNYSGTRIARSSPPACNDAWNGKDASPERKGVQENGAGSDKSLPIITVDIADIPGGGQLHLLQCGTEFSIQFGDDELMGSRDHESEKALARLTQERLVQRDGNILIGGLGMGFTLGAALDAWSQSATITVAELVPKIISWANGPLMHLFGTNLTDPRVRIQLPTCLMSLPMRRIASMPFCSTSIMVQTVSSEKATTGFIRPTAWKWPMRH